MKIHGIRFYLKSISKISPHGSPIFLHKRLSETQSDFQYIFHPLFQHIQGNFTVESFTVSYTERGEKIEDPLEKIFGDSIVAKSSKDQFVVLKTDRISEWAKTIRACEGAFYPIFWTRPTMIQVKAVYGKKTMELSSSRWPKYVKSIINNWDGIYWEYFTTVESEVNLLINTHRADPLLEMFRVDFDREFPEPSNEDLIPV